MKEEKIEIISEGQRVIGILHTPKISNGKTIVMAHGITVDKDEGIMFVDCASKLCENGYTVLRFDFRGHGESEGDSVDLTVEGEINDLNEAVKFIENRGFEDIGIVAASFGASIASLYTPKNKNIKALVFWYPVLNYESVFLRPITEWGVENFSGRKFEEDMERYGYVTEHKGFKIGRKIFESMRKAEPWKSMIELPIPILIIHGDADTYVPYEDSKKYYKMAKNAELATIEGADHGFDEDKNVERAIELSVSWFNRWLL